MKKLIALLMTLCLLCGTTALATEYKNGQGTPQTVLKVTIDESYTLVIPATVNIPFNALRTDLPIEVKELRCKPADDAQYERLLYVQISSNNGKLTDAQGTHSIRFNLDPGEQKGNMKALFFDKVGTKNMTIGITQDAWNAAPAGSYSSTITFTAAIAKFAK